MQQKHIWASLAAFILTCFIIELFGGFWTRETVSTWYPMLIKPSWTPPNWVFGPVWTCLYMMIAFSGWLIYRAKDSHNRTAALQLYGLQLALNFLWSFLFFSLRNPFLGLIDITLLCLLVILTIIKTWPVTRLGTLLLIPYLFWIVYAATLNAGIWFLNRPLA